MDYQFEEVYVGEPLDTARIINNIIITHPNGRHQKELRQQQSISEPQQAINGKRKKSKSQQGMPSVLLRESRILRLVKRLAHKNRVLQAEVERFAHENQALRADVNERGETIEILQQGLKRLSGEAVALVQNSGLAHRRDSPVRDQRDPTLSAAENSVSALRWNSAEHNQSSPGIGPNGTSSCHREYEELDVKQELDEGEDAIAVGVSNDHDCHDHEYHEHGSASEQDFEGFEDDSQNDELHRHGEDGQRGDFAWPEREESVDMNEEREIDDDPTHQVQEMPNYSIVDIGLLVEDEDDDFTLVTGLLPEALKLPLEELFNETFSAEMEVRKEKDSRRLTPRKKRFHEHWNDHAKNTSACVKQFLKANRTTYAIDDKDYIACRTCFRAQLSCIRWSAAAKQFYVCLLPKVSCGGGEFDEAWDYIYPEKNMSAELEEEHGVLWTGK